MESQKAGRKAAVERAARLAAVLKGLGYRGIHLSGIQKNFQTVSMIIDRFEQIQDQWRDFLEDFTFEFKHAFYFFDGFSKHAAGDANSVRTLSAPGWFEKTHYRLLGKIHDLFFSHDRSLSRFYEGICRRLDNPVAKRLITDLIEGPAKRMMLNCRHCGDCAIQHVGFLCPEAGCPKHTRNGACGGSRDSRCEVHPDRLCVRFRAYNRMVSFGHAGQLAQGCVPPRMWELDHTSSWINFHLRRDHQGTKAGIGMGCRANDCHVLPSLT